MVRTENMKIAQQKWRKNNPEKWRMHCRKVMKRNYNEEKKINKSIYYFKIRNYRGLDNIEKDIRRLFIEE